LDTAAALDQLHEFVNKIHPLSGAAWDEFAAVWSPFEARRKTMLTAAGQTERYLYFVVDGIQRVYYAKPDGKEATIIFTYAPSFSGVVDSLLLQQPSRYHLETLTQSSFLRTHYQQWQQLMEQSKVVANITHIAMLGALSGVMQRMTELQCYSAEEKFKTLLARSPHVLRLIPHKYLANYLGIDATTFSKLLGSVRL
jgi:CRP-like cAMP-binding protein